MGPGDVFLALIVVGLPVMLLMIIANRYFRLAREEARGRGVDGCGEGGAICVAEQ